MAEAICDCRLVPTIAPGCGWLGRCLRRRLRHRPTRVFAAPKIPGQPGECDEWQGPIGPARRRCGPGRAHGVDHSAGALSSAAIGCASHGSLPRQQPPLPSWSPARLQEIGQAGGHGGGKVVLLRGEQLLQSARTGAGFASEHAQDDRSEHAEDGAYRPFAEAREFADDVRKGTEGATAEQRGQQVLPRARGLPRAADRVCQVLRRAGGLLGDGVGQLSFPAGLRDKAARLERIAGTAAPTRLLCRRAIGDARGRRHLGDEVGRQELRHSRYDVPSTWPAPRFA